MRKLLIEVTIDDNGDISLSAVQEEPHVEAAAEPEEVHHEPQAVAATEETIAAITEPETPVEIAAAPEEGQTQTQQV